MAKIQSQKMKLLYLLQILLTMTDDEHGLTLSQLLDELEKKDITAERKSIYDDFEALRLFGIDIESRKENRTTVYFVANRTFELPELKLLVDAVQSSKFITHRKSNELIKKLEAFCSVHQASQLQRQVFVANRVKTMNESIYYCVDDIHNAISENRQITFQYFDWGTDKKKHLRHDGKLYRVSPWALSWDDENYYMIAFDSENEEIRHYRVDKMMNVNLTGEKRAGAKLFKNFDMAVYAKKTFGMFAGEERDVTLRCKNHLAGVLIDRFGHSITMTNDGDDYFTVTVKAAVSPLFITWLMNFGDDVKILSPDDVIEKYVEIAKECLGIYKDDKMS